MKKKSLLILCLAGYLLLGSDVVKAHAIATSLSTGYFDWSTFSFAGDVEYHKLYSSSSASIENIHSGGSVINISDSQINSVGDPTSAGVNDSPSFASAWNDSFDTSQIDANSQADGVNVFLSQVYAEARSDHYFTALSDGYVIASIEYFLFHEIEIEHISEYASAETAAALILNSDDNTSVLDADSAFNASYVLPTHESATKSGTAYVEKWFNEGESGYLTAWTYSRLNSVSYPSPTNGDHQNVVPEPATFLLFGGGMMGAFAARKKRKA